MITMSVSMVIGSLLAWFLIEMLLAQIYKYYTSVGIITLASSGIAIVVMGLLTTSSTIIKAATTNPARILRTE